MNQIDWVAIFLLGLFGTGHCIGMCGPLVVALPGQTGRLKSHLYYHTGRLLTYTAIGALMGGIGTGVALLCAWLQMTPENLVVHIRLVLSLLASVFLLGFGLIQLGFVGEPRWIAAVEPDKAPGYSRLLKGVLTQPDDRGLFLAGLLLGLLPCGLSYAAFSRALAAGSLFKGAMFLFVFGAGTFPGLFLVGTVGTSLWIRFRRQLNIVAGILMIAMAAKLGWKSFAAFSATLH
jgi:sulfite exporter TauE/SafE